MMDNDTRIKCQAYIASLNKEPDPREFEPTPDGKARTLPISFVQMTLDEIYQGRWEMSDVSFQQIFNEVVGTGILTVWHPVLELPIRRAGWASVVITQDKDAQIAEFNATKKKNALDLAFPKLGAEVLKNAATSLGKVFGRDINRKKQDTFKPPLKPMDDKALEAAVKRAEAGDVTVLPLAEQHFLLTEDQRALLAGANSKLLSDGRI